MRNEDFNIFAKNRFRDCMKILQGKNKDYMRNDNKFHNFVQAADMMGVSSIQALAGMKIKHTVSIMDMIKDYEQKGILPSIETLSEKIGDEINYLVILEAMFRELITHKELDEILNKYQKRRCVFINDFFKGM